MVDFVLADRLVVERDVAVKVPKAGTGFETANLRVAFRILDMAEAEKLSERMDAHKADIGFLREVFVGLPDGVKHESGSVLPDSPELRDRLIGLPYVRLALLRAYTEAQTGGALGN